MIKKSIYIFLFAVFAFHSAEASKIGQFDYIFNNAMLNETNYTFAVQKGTFEEEITKKNYPYATYRELETFDEALECVHIGICDATLVSSALQGTIEKKYTDLKMTFVAYFLHNMGIGVTRKRRDILEKLNSFLATAQQEGTLDDMYRRWITRGDEKMPEIKEVQNPNETIVFAVEKSYPPMSYEDKNGALKGYFVELVQRFAVYANIKAKIKPFYFDEIPNQVKSDAVQVWVSNIVMTPERREFLNFTNSFLKENLSVIIKKDRYINEKDLSVFFEKPIGTLPGDVSILESEIPLANEMLYNSNDQLFSALENYEIVGANVAFPVGLRFVENNPDYVIYPATLGKNIYSFMFSVDHGDLRDYVNDLQDKHLVDGTFRTAHSIWFGMEEYVKVLPPVPNSKKNLIVGFVPDASPFSYIDENIQPQGFAVHIMNQYLQKLGYGVEKFIPLDYERIFDALEKREIDVAIGDLKLKRDS